MIGGLYSPHDLNRYYGRYRRQHRRLEWLRAIDWCYVVETATAVILALPVLLITITVAILALGR